MWESVQKFFANFWKNILLPGLVILVLLAVSLGAGILIGYAAGNKPGPNSDQLTRQYDLDRAAAESAYNELAATNIRLEAELAAASSREAERSRREEERARAIDGDIERITGKIERISSGEFDLEQRLVTVRGILQDAVKSLAGSRDTQLDFSRGTDSGGGGFDN